MRRHIISTVLTAGLLIPAVGHAADARSTSSDRAEATGATEHAKKKKKPVPRFTFRFPGRGFGHGVGMSQYGAYGMALDGKSAEDIITTYYRGTTISELPTTTVRVLLVGGAPRARVSSSDELTVGGGDGDGSQTLPGDTELFVRHAGGGRIVVARADGRTVAERKGSLVLTPKDGGTISLNGTRYRGSLQVTQLGSSVRVINVIDLEDYLLGVVPREMPASWGDRAPAVLEAQAITARSYAIATKKAGPFDMYADERSQVYGGAGGEDSRTSAAVRATAGKVATYQGKVATTYFFSTSGGRTENSENVFSNPVPYLVSINDATYDRISPRHLWRGEDIQRFTDTRLGQLLGTKPVLSMKIIKRSASPRALRVRITTRSGGVKIMTGPEVRRALGLRSHWFEIRRSVR